MYLSALVLIPPCSQLQSVEFRVHSLWAGKESLISLAVGVKPTSHETVQGTYGFISIIPWIPYALYFLEDSGINESHISVFSVAILKLIIQWLEALLYKDSVSKLYLGSLSCTLTSNDYGFSETASLSPLKPLVLASININNEKKILTL